MMQRLPFPEWVFAVFAAFGLVKILANPPEELGKARALS